MQLLADATPADTPVRPARRLLRPADTGARSASDVVERGLDTLALVWQALWILGEPDLWPTNQSTVAASLALVAAFVTWLALLTVRLLSIARLQRWARGANVIALTLAAGTVLAAGASATPPAWGPASSLAVLSTSLAGLLFITRIAAAWSIAVVTVESVVVLGLGDSLRAATVVPTDVLYPMYALSLGIVTMSARWVLTRDARRTDAAAADLVSAEQERLAAEGVEQAMHREERLLHETVLNTLTAIMRGGLTATDDVRDRLRQRCRDSAEVLRQLGRSEPGLLDRTSEEHRLDLDLQVCFAELHAAGTTLHVDCEALDAVPPPVYAAIRAAANEALVNVARHADAGQVWFTAHAIAHGVTPAVRVEVRDDGRGFDIRETSQRYGIRGAVLEGVGQVGGTAHIESAPGSGTRIVVEWAPDAAIDVAAPYFPASSAFAIPVVVSFGLFTTVVAVLTRGDVLQPGLAAAAFVLLVVMSVLLVWGSSRGTLPWWVVLTLAGIAPLMYQLQSRSTIEPHGPWTDWSSASLVALFVVAAGAGPTWSWLALLVTWLFIQGDIVHELMAAGTAMLASAALFGRSTRRNAEEVNRARSRELAALAARADAEEGAAEIRRRYGALSESAARDLLDGIAAGTIDPDDPAARATAAMEERFIRTVMRVDPAMDGVHAFAADLAVAARRRGVFLDVDLTATPSPSQFPTPADRQSLAWAIESSETGGNARLSARTEGGDYVIRLIAPVVGEQRRQTRALPVRGVVLDPTDADMLWEIRQHLGGADA